MMASYGMDKRFPEDFNYFHLEWLDEINTNIIRQLPSAIEFLETALNQGATVLVHCQDGISCSGAVIMALLICTYKMPLASA
jgi:serine/threonine/tyrosine-interacting protein